MNRTSKLHLLRALLVVAPMLVLTSCGGSDSPGPTGPGPNPNPNPAPTTGLIQVTTLTTGDDLDPDGYMAGVDGNGDRSIGLNGVTTFTAVTTGQHQVALTGLEANCSVTGSNPSTVTVTAGATAQVGFAVTCVATSGSIEIITVTTGSFLDPNEYGLIVDGVPRLSLGINEAVTLTSFSVGEHTVELDDVAGNCTVAGANPTTTTLAVGANTQVTFRVVCNPPAPGMLAFLSGSNEPQLEVFVMDGAGEVVTQVTQMAADKWGFAQISPDGTRILFVAGELLQRDLWVVNMDGTGLLNLTNSSDAVQRAEWSPDGTQVAYGTRSSGLWIISASGGVPRLLEADHIMGLDWSPDGTRIVFSNNNDPGIFVINSDGSGLQRLTLENADGNWRKVHWSPDGSRILYHYHGPPNISTGNDIYVMNSDGSGVTQLTSFDHDEGNATWSPDGSMIAFGTYPISSQGLWVMNADGSGMLELVAKFADTPVWSPDGSTIAFNALPLNGMEIYTIRPDGSGLSNITNTGSAKDFLGSWVR